MTSDDLPQGSLALIPSLQRISSASPPSLQVMLESAQWSRVPGA